ncbi:MAG: carboxypeptidase regulatory-like domain-containing protein, partial [Candidatus Electryonea clarkiae]|nr:carboxypeptidase regulatory-like domain-containing protein [Candidatus Electryonea clarkiae]
MMKVSKQLPVRLFISALTTGLLLWTFPGLITADSNFVTNLEESSAVGIVLDGVLINVPGTIVPEGFVQSSQKNPFIPGTRSELDEIFELDFDDDDRPSSFNQITALRDDYEELGITFEGPDDDDGGGVLNQAGGFRVTGHSEPNFLAFNTNSGFSDDGIPRGPETIRFEEDVISFQIDAGHSSSGTITMTAYDAADNELDSDEIVGAATLAEMSVEADGIEHIVISFTGTVCVMDNIVFETFEGEPDAILQGIVTDSETGEAVEGAEVLYRNVPDITDVNGFYSFDECHTGIRLIRCVHEDYSFFSEEIEIETGENVFNIEITHLSEVSGYIYDVDTEDPIEDVSVTFGEEGTTTDEDGYWAIPLQEQGEYAVLAMADHYYEFRDDVEVIAGDNNFEWDLIPLATISGTITDSETDLPVEGAEISYDTLYSAVSDENGEYLIIDVRAGEYQVTIETEGYFDFEEDAVEVEERENIIDFAIDILSATLSGAVRDELTEELLFGVTVTVIDEATGETMYEVLTDEAGEYTTGTLHDGESFLVTATMAGYAPSDDEEVPIRWNRENVQDFVLTPIFARGIQQLQQEQDLETWVTTTGIVTQGTNVTDIEQTSIYIQDDSGWGINIWSDDPWDPENNINRGDGVTVVGFLVEVDEMTRITQFEIEVSSNDNALPDALIESTGDMSENNQREGTWGQISGQINRDPPGEGDFSLIVDDGSGQCEVRIAETTGIDMSEFSINDWGTFTGVIGLSRQGLRIIPNMQGDIIRIPINPPTDLTSEQEVKPGDPLQLEVTLNWAHENLDEWLRFKIYRDGEHIGNTQQNTWSEILEDPIPGEFGSYTYEYEVTAVYDEGETEGAEIEVIWDITLVHERPYSGVP